MLLQVSHEVKLKQLNWFWRGREMKKDKNWLKEQLSYLQEGVGESFNDYSKGLNAAYNTIGLLINELEEPEQEEVVIPQFVADWIETMKQQDFTLGQVAEHLYSGDIKWSLLREYERWARLNFTKFTRAWLDGYSVEKEKLYYVRENNYLLCKHKGEVIDYVEAIDRRITNSVKLKLTEQEIKDYDERYWAFAEEITK